MTQRTDMLDRCRATYDLLHTETGYIPTKSAVARTAGVSSSTVDHYWDLLTGVVETHRQVQVAAKRTCLSCRRPFASGWAGHRVCGRCKSLDAWRSGEHDYSLSF